VNLEQAKIDFVLVNQENRGQSPFSAEQKKGSDPGFPKKPRDIDKKMKKLERYK